MNHYTLKLGHTVLAEFLAEGMADAARVMHGLLNDGSLGWNDFKLVDLRRRRLRPEPSCDSWSEMRHNARRALCCELGEIERLLEPMLREYRRNTRPSWEDVERLRWIKRELEGVLS